MEDDDFVHPVEEFGPEDLLELARDARLHLLVADAGLAALHKAQRHVLGDGLGADVAGHDENGVAEIDRAPLGVGEAPILEDLQEDVEHVGVRLLDLVEEHHAIRLAAHDLGELAAFLVTDVARRRADEA